MTWASLPAKPRNLVQQRPARHQEFSSPFRQRATQRGDNAHAESGINEMSPCCGKGMPLTADGVLWFLVGVSPSGER